MQADQSSAAPAITDCGGSEKTRVNGLRVRAFLISGDRFPERSG
jgi:hypothetical protein